jgi:predicted dehydrogenase
MDQVNVGIIGCGYWGPNLVRNFFDLPSVNLVAVSDLKQDRLTKIRSAYNSIYTTQNYEELFKMDLKALVIATPPPTHHTIATKCLDNGINVLVEKPITLKSEDAKDLCDLARTNDLTLMVGHTFEYNPAVHALRDLMESGDMGDIHYIDTARLNLGLFQRGLNVLWDLAPHDISILLYLLRQNPICVSSHGMSCVLEKVHDVVYLNLTFPNGVLAHVHVSWLDPCKVRRVTVVGSKKMVVYNDIEMQEKLRIYDKGVDSPPRGTTQLEETTFSYRYGDITIPNIKMAEPLKQECLHFIDCVQNKKEPISSGEEGYRVVKILEAAQRSLVDSGHKEVIEW